MAPRQSRPGFGLLEMILVFALLIGAGAIVFVAFRSAEAGAHASEAVDQTKLVISNLRSVNAEYRVNNNQNMFIYAAYSNATGAALRQEIS